MKRFSAIFFAVCLLGTVYGIQFPIKTYEEWANQVQSTLNPELADLIVKLNGIAETKSPATEIFAFPDTLNAITAVLVTVVDDIDKFLTATTNYANNPVSTSNPYFDFPRSQVQPYLAIYPGLRSQLNAIVANVEELGNILDNKLRPVAIKEKVNGNVIALPPTNAIKILHQISADIQQIVVLIQNASKQSIKAEGPTVTIMTYINGAMTRVIPQIELFAIGIENSTNDIKVGKPNAQGLVNVDFGNAVKTLNGYIVQVIPILCYLEHTINTIALLLNLAGDSQSS